MLRQGVCSFSSLFFFFFFKKTEDTEKQQLGQIRRKNHKHVPLSRGPDLSAASPLSQHWDSHSRNHSQVIPEFTNSKRSPESTAVYSVSQAFS